jgi:hypothetical protein
VSVTWRSAPGLQVSLRGGGHVPALRRGVNSSQVADPWISPLTILHPPNASGGNMYLHLSQRISGAGAGR